MLLLSLQTVSSVSPTRHLTWKGVLDSSSIAYRQRLQPPLPRYDFGPVHLQIKSKLETKKNPTPPTQIRNRTHRTTRNASRRFPTQHRYDVRLDTSHLDTSRRTFEPPPAKSQRSCGCRRRGASTTRSFDTVNSRWLRCRCTRGTRRDTDDRCVDRPPTNSSRVRDTRPRRFRRVQNCDKQRTCPRLDPSSRSTRCRSSHTFDRSARSLLRSCFVSRPSLLRRARARTESCNCSRAGDSV